MTTAKQGKDFLAFPLDVASLSEATSLVAVLAPHVGVFKIGLELFISQGPKIVQKVRQAGGEKIFLDLKLHDITATVERAMNRVAEMGVDMVTVHCASSRAMLEAAVRGGQGKTKVLGVTLLTDNDGDTVARAGFKDQYARDVGELVRLRARTARDAGCAGVVCAGSEAAQVKAALGRDFLAVTPGIRPQWHLSENDDQKRVVTPAKAVSRGSDLLVIGRPIRDAKDPARAARKVVEEIETALAGKG